MCSKYDIIVLVETWLNDDYVNSEVILKNFNIYRRDRRTGRGGGVLIATKNCLKSKVISINSSSVEDLFVLVSLEEKNYIFGTVYIPPNTNNELYMEHCDTVEKLTVDYPEHKLVIFGDYNIPNAEWSNDELGLDISCPLNSMGMVVAERFAFLNLFQNNKIPNNRGVYLDLVFSHLRDIAVSASDDPLTNNSLHHIAYDIVLPTAQRASVFQYEEIGYDLRNANFLDINSSLASVDWDTVLSDDVEVAVQEFYDIIHQLFSLFVPVKRFKSSTFPRWFSRSLIHLIHLKKESHRNFKLTKLNTDYIHFQDLRRRCKRLTEQCYTNYLHKLEADMQSDSRRFWKFIGDRKRETSFPCNMYLNDACCDNGQDMVNLFAEHFSSVYRDYNNTVMPDYDFRCNVSMCSLSIDLESIINAICKLSNSNASGADGISNNFLKGCVFTVCKPLHILFNLSLRRGVFPELWKTSFITPIFKSGDRACIANYRGVCIQSPIPKLLDKLVTARLTWAFRNLVVVEQHGFREGKSVTTNLLTYQNYILDAFERKVQVDSIYTDFSKAFDGVNHTLLLAKLSGFGVGGAVLRWIGSFLSGRGQVVKVKNYLSNEIRVPSGVAQGSHCGPLLFNLFINDIKNIFEDCEILLFADDLKLYRSVNSDGDALMLQRNLNNLTVWCENNCMLLNVDKCHIITFTRSDSNCRRFDYLLSGSRLRRVKETRDLGILFDDKLTFVKHILQISGRARKMLGFVSRSTREFSVHTYRILYCSMVRPVLEYASVVWSPHFTVHKRTLEDVQERFLRAAAYRIGVETGHFDCALVLSQLGLDTLDQRRLKHDVCFLHSILNGHLHCPELLSHLSFLTFRRTRNGDLFYLPYHPAEYGCHSPLTRMMRLINANSNLDLFVCNGAGFRRSLKYKSVLG